MRAADADPSLRNFLVDLLDHFGVRIKDHEEGDVFLDPSHAYVESFPSIPADGMLATFDRARAIDDSVSRATVYRTLPIMTESALLREVDIGSGEKFYRPNAGTPNAQVAQVVCVDCDKIFEISAPFMEWYGSTVSLKLGLKPVAQLVAHATHSQEPQWFTTAPVGAIEKLYAKTGWNTGSVDLKYLAVSNVVDIETCEYPDSNKIMIAAGPRGERAVRKMFRAETDVDYYDRESMQQQ